MIDRALAFAAHYGERHPNRVTRELVEMVVRAPAGDRAAQPEGVAFAAQIGARHAFRRNQMMDPGGGRETHSAALAHDAREEFGVLARHRIAADNAQLLAEASEASESLAAKSHIRAEIVVNRIELVRRRS